MTSKIEDNAEIGPFKKLRMM